MASSRIDSDPAIGDIADLDGDLDAIARDTGYADGLEYAGFWIRFGAVLIDTTLLMVVTVPLLVWIYGWGYYSDGKLIAGPADFLINWLAPAAATVLFWRLWQATPGKAMLSLRVVDADTGKALSVGQGAARYICYMLSALPLGLGFIWVAFDRKKQGWHDKIAQTVVVRAKDRGPERVRFGERANSNPGYAAGRSEGGNSSQASHRESASRRRGLLCFTHRLHAGSRGFPVIADVSQTCHQRCQRPHGPRAAGVAAR